MDPEKVDMEHCLQAGNIVYRILPSSFEFIIPKGNDTSRAEWAGCSAQKERSLKICQ